MFKIKLLLIAGASTLFGNAIAQTGKPAYSGFINAGAMFGSNDTKIHAQTIHGLKMNGWFGGIGVAVDDYFFQSFPVFVDLRKEVLNKTNTPFIYADGGINMVRKDMKETYMRIDNKPGIFYEGGVGYKIGLNNRIGLNFSAGYSFKAYTEETYTRTYNPSGGTTEEWINSKTDKYALERLALKIGLEF